MVKKYKLSKKHNVSELMNPKKSKKYSILHSTYNNIENYNIENYKNNINLLIEKKNKRKNIKTHQTQQIQKGGKDKAKKPFFAKSPPAPEHAKAKLLFGFSVKAASRTNGIKFDSSNFRAFTKAYKSINKII